MKDPPPAVRDYEKRWVTVNRAEEDASVRPASTPNAASVIQSYMPLGLWSTR